MKYVDIAIAGRAKILRIVKVLDNMINHAIIRRTGQIIRSIPFEWKVS